MSSPLLIDIPDRIETARLLMRAPQPGDGAMLFEAVAEALPELRRFLAFLPWVATEQSVEMSEIYCRTANSNFVARRDLPFLLIERSSSQLVGCSGLHRPNWSTPKVEVGYWVRPSRAGQGFITEAVNALVKLAFERLAVARIELITDEDNLASRRVADRCSFGLEGVLRHERRDSDGSLRNTCIYARTSDGA